MPDERPQFRVLYRDFMHRLVDLEVLSSSGDVGRLLAQFGAMLAALSFTITIFTFPAFVRSPLPYSKLIVHIRTQEEFLIAITMAVAGLFSVLAWNAVFPDRRDCLILGLLPVRIRTIFLAKAAAIATSLGVIIAAVNIFSGLFFPLLAVAPGGGFFGGLRCLGTYWLTLAASGLFVCCALLALQGVAAQFLTYRLFLRLSSFMQLAAFFAILGVFFLKPSFVPSTVDRGPAYWMPSFWFCGLLQQLQGASDPGFTVLAHRAMISLAAALGLAGITFALAYQRNIRRIIEQPDIAPADRSRPATRVASFLAGRLLARPIERALCLFIARTVARSRQHRLLLAAYAGIGLAISLAYARDLVYPSTSFDRLYSNIHWNQVNGPLLVGSLVLMFFAVIGVRATFAMPISLRANWIFRVTAVHSPAAYSAAVRKSLFALTVLPICLLWGVAFPLLWPIVPALQHVAILAVVGVLLVEMSLHHFRKLPFACSYLPGKANLNVRLGVGGIAFLAATSFGVQIEYASMKSPRGFLVLLAILVGIAVWARRRTAEFARSAANRIQFEDLPTADVTSLDLRADGVWSGEEVYVDALDHR